MNYIIIDMANMFWRCKHIASRFADTSEKVGMALHITLNSINQMCKVRNVDHVVAAVEGRSWRKDFYKPYKANRANRNSILTESEKKDEEEYNKAYNDLISFFCNKTNITVLHNSVLEADDLIAGWCQNHPNDNHVIISADTDFYQLLSENVSQYNGIANELHTIHGIYNDDNSVVIDKKTKEPKVVPDPKWLLFEKCVRGDTSDNIFSAYPGVRTNGTKSKIGIREAYEDSVKQGFNYNSFMLNRWVDHEGVEHVVRDDFQRNKTLIDLSAQPENIRNIIDETIKNINKKTNSMVGIQFMKFCGKYQLIKISEYSEQYSSWMNKSYVV